MKDYIGDGVYVEWNGWALILTLEEQNASRITLDDSVYTNLLNFVERVKQRETK